MNCRSRKAGQANVKCLDATPTTPRRHRRARVADLLVALDRAGLELPIFRLPIGQRHSGVGGDGREPAEIGPTAIARFAAVEIHSIHIAVGFPKLEAHLLGGRAGEIGQLRRVVLGLKGVTVASSRRVVPIVPALYAGVRDGVASF